MPPSASPARSSVAPRRSPLLVRSLLLGACGAGLLGLAVPGHHAASTDRVSLAATSQSASVLLEPAARHGLVLTPTRTTPRANRSRPVAAKKPVAHTLLVSHKVSALRLVTGWVRPSGASVVSPYGMRWGRMHKGLDFGARYGAPIYAIGDGVVVGTGYQSGESGYGQITIIRHADGFYSAYAHQSRMVVHAGDHVRTGEIIGYVGATGQVTGPHLHFEIRTEPHGGQINPRPWLAQHGVDV